MIEGVEELNEEDGAADEYEQHDVEENGKVTCGKVARWQVGCKRQ